AGIAGDAVADRVGADIDVIAVRAREGGRDIDAARVELAIVDLDVDVVVADRQFVGRAPGLGDGPAIVIGGGGGGGADEGGVVLGRVGDDRAALVVKHGLVGAGAGATGQVPGVAGVGAGL